MSLLKTTAVTAVLATISSVSAHGMVQGIVAGGQYHPGYVVGYSYSPSHPPLVAWSQPENKDTGFIDPPMYKNPDSICGKGATPAELSATVPAGGTVELQWTDWPESHHGPVMDYLANCNGDCTSVDKTKLQFNKIDEAGLIDPSIRPGHWASDDLIAANNSWTVTIPKSVAPGNYVLRHEIIALHASHELNGAQNYPQCVSLKVTGSGTDSLASGTLGTQLYTADEAGILFNIYKDLTSYPIPGPELHSGGSSSGPTTLDASSSSTPTTVSASGSGDSEATSTGKSGPVPTASGYSTLSMPNAPYPTGNGTIPHPESSKEPEKASTTSKTLDAVPTSSSAVEPSTPSTTAAASSDDNDDHETPSSDDNDDNYETPSTTPEDDTEATVPPTKETGSGSGNSDHDGTDAEQPESKNLSKDSLAGMTVQQLIDLLKLIVKELEGKMGGKVRRHARDFLDF